jgi:hypothetical protein
METSNMASEKEVWNSTICRGSYVVTLFVMHKGHYQGRGITVHSIRYSEILQDQLKPAVPHC